MMQPMARVPPFDRLATYEDLVALPEIYIAEIIGGELYGTRRLPPRHSVASSALGWRIGEAYDIGRGRSSPWRIFRAPEIHMKGDVLVPDWGGWLRSRLPTLAGLEYFPVAPDWVCEVLTPDTVALDRAKKLSIYAREQVSHAWLLDPSIGTLEVLRLEDGRWTILGTHIDADIVRAEPFAEVTLELSALWAD